MKYRKLGQTGIEVSEIGFGCWGLGGTAYGNVDDEEAERALALALEKGVTFYDTSDLYGEGHSEELLGAAFASCRERIVLATKGGLLPHHTFTMPQDFSAKHLSKALDASLKRLGTDYVDLYQLHSPEIDKLENNDEFMPALESFKRAGKTRALGVSVRSPADGIMAIERYEFDTIQVNFNMIDQRAFDEGLFALARKKNVGVILRTPLVFGYLTGTLSGTERFEDNKTDHRANWPEDQLKRWAGSATLFDFLTKGEGRSPARAAIRFCLDFEEIGVVIPGMMNRAHVEDNTGASDLSRLSAEEHALIRQIYETHDFYDKSAKARGKQ